MSKVHWGGSADGPHEGHKDAGLQARSSHSEVYRHTDHDRHASVSSAQGNHRVEHTASTLVAAMLPIGLGSAHISQLSGHTWTPPKSMSLISVWLVKSWPVCVAQFDCGICGLRPAQSASERAVPMLALCPESGGLCILQIIAWTEAGATNLGKVKARPRAGAGAFMFPHPFG